MGDFISGIVFSRDRALQLDAVLRSFFFHCKEPEKVKLSVLYKATNGEHQNQYSEIKKDYPQVDFIQQGDFRKNVNDWLITSSTYERNHNIYEFVSSLFLLSRKNKIFRVLFNRHIRNFLVNLLPYDPQKIVMFLVDDNIFTRDFLITPICNSLMKDPKALGFSLRLGINTTYCYSHDSAQRLPFFTNVTSNILKYTWTTSEHDFAYPLEVSSSCYRLKQILPLFLKVFFSNPNSLEGVMASLAFSEYKSFPNLLCFETSVTFCNPINIVQIDEKNRAGTKSSYSPESLAQLFASGQRIDINALNQFIPNGCHQEVELNFVSPKL